MLIITHPGGAHRDDLLSVSIALAVLRREQGALTKVVRRDPTPVELEDPRVLVLDVGGVYDPALSDFDHHQLPRDAEAECALSLYAPTVSWEGVSVIEALELTKWFEITKIIDAKGPFQAAKQLNTTPAVVFALQSPLEADLLEEFGETNGEVSVDLRMRLAAHGERLLNRAAKVLRQVNGLNDRCRIVEAAGVTGYVLEDVDTTGTAEWRERFAPGTMFSVVYDNRGPGWTLFRYDDDPRLDFSLVEASEKVVFARPFIAKTADRAAVTLEQALQLVAAAVVDSAE